MMKTLIYVLMFIILGSLIYNLASIDYNTKLFTDYNRPFIIGTGAGVCGFILSLIMIQYYRLKPRLKNLSEKE